MRFKILMYLALNIGLIQGVNAQYHQRVVDSLRETSTFNEIVDVIENYYKDKDKGKGTGYKHFKRWEELNSGQLDDKGFLQNYTLKLWDELYKNQNLNRTSRVAASSSQGNWRNIGFNQYVAFGEGYNGGVGRVNFITADPANENILYAGTPAGGLWRSMNGGNGDWECITSAMLQIGVSSIVIDPTSPVNNRTIYILTGDKSGGDTGFIGVLKSSDNGVSWNSTSNITGNIGYRMLMDPTDSETLFVTVDNKLYKTINGGFQWTLIHELTSTIRDLEFHTSNSSIIYLAGNKGEVKYSLNGGTSWQTSTGLYDNIDNKAINVQLGVSPANSNFVYAILGRVKAKGEFYGFYLSTDAGKTFTLKSKTPNILGYEKNGSGSKNQAYRNLAIAISPTNENEVHIGGINCWKSTDAGVTWEITSYWEEPYAGYGNYTHADISDLMFIGNNIACVSDGGVFISSDHAENWIDKSTGLNISQLDALTGVQNNPSLLMAGGQDIGTNRIENNIAYHWDGADGKESLINPVNNNIIYATNQASDIFKSIDNGLHRIDAKPQNINSSFSNRQPLMYAPNNPGVLFTAYRDVYKSYDEGTTWTNITNGIFGTSSIFYMTIAPNDDDYIYVSIGGYKLFRTTNGGSSWEEIFNGSHSQILVNPTNKNEVWLTNYSTIHHTIDGGLNWIELPAEHNINTIAYQKGSNNRIFVGTNLGIYYFDDNTTEWVEFNEGLPLLKVTALDINYTSNTIRIATYGRGIWESDLPKIDCNEHITINTLHTGDSDYWSKKITTYNQFTASSNTELYASEMIKFEVGTKISNNAKLKAQLKPFVCSDPSSSLARNTSKELIGYYDGPMPGLVEKKSYEYDQLEESTIVSIYPNPTSSDFTVNFSINDDDESVTILLSNSVGVVLKTLIEGKQFNSGDYKVNYTVDDLPNGVYYVTFNNGILQQTKQLMIVR